MRTLRDTWVMHGSEIKAEGDAAKITDLLKDKLERLNVTDGGWRRLLRRSTDGSLWELSFPQSEMHGGGPRVLIELEITDPAEWV